MTSIARVSQIDYTRGMLKVAVQDRENAVSNWVPMESFEYDPPHIGDLVTVDFYGEDWTDGVCRGKYFGEENMPAYSGESVCYKKFGDDVVFQYDKAAKLLTITADTIRLVGNVEISGSLRVEKDVAVGGTVTASAVVAGSITEGGG